MHIALVFMVKKMVMVKITFETPSCLVSFLDELATFSGYEVHCLIFISKQSIFSLSMHSYGGVFVVIQNALLVSLVRFTLYGHVCIDLSAIFSVSGHTNFLRLFFYFSLLCFLGISVNSSVGFGLQLFECLVCEVDAILNAGKSSSTFL